jgi:isopenicillin N synthase-like dioxygenase
VTSRYFPPQTGSDNLKEGFELGTPSSKPSSLPTPAPKFNLTEANVFPRFHPSFRTRCETLHTELQSLSSKLLSLLAVALGKPSSFFDHYLTDSLSTLRLLHYPPVPAARQQELICTPHTDSGILTLLHQDNTGGLEVRNSEGEWIPTPYVPGSMVVNIGDLMAKVSGGRWVATFHRVRSAKREGEDQVKGRYSVPFFFEPGLNCVVRSVEGDEVIYGEHVLEKMKGWVEFQDVVESKPERLVAERTLVESF